MSTRATPSRQPLAEADPNVALSVEQPSTNGNKKTSAKRKAAAIEDKESEKVPEIDDYDLRLVGHITENCDQIRRKINTFIQNGGMKVGEFQDALGVSGNSYRTFLGQSGKFKGEGSDTYVQAARFFKKRELQGLKMPRKPAAKKAKPSSSSKADEDNFDVSGIHLDGEENQQVPVYDTCDVIRRKIRAHLREPSVTKAGFLREITKTLPDGKKIAATTLDRFLGQTGSNAGNTTALFYAAYVYFEKLRIKANKPITKFREEMEQVWGPRGMDRVTPSNTRYFCSADTQLYTDQYGRLQSVRCL